MLTRITLMLVVGALASAAGGTSITLERIATVDFTGQIQGDNLTSVAWDGTNLYVAPYTNTARDVAITAADNALTAPMFRSFGAVTVTAYRGYSGLTINQFGQLGAVVCSTGAALGTNVGIYDAASGALITNAPSTATTAGGGGAPRTGPAWDPIKGGLVFTNFGSGRHRQIDAAGNALWTDAAGPYNYDAMWGTAWMDTDIDANGNVYSREGQQIIKFTRTGPDTFQAPFTADMNLTPQFYPSDGDGTFGLNLAILEGFDVILWNDRTDTGGGQLAENVLKAIDLEGNVVDLVFANSPSDFLGNAMFDFSYDSVSQTLAVSEFSSNRVYIYNVTPEPAALALLAMAVGLIRRR